MRYKNYSQFKSTKHQSGMTFWSLSFVIGFVVFSAYVGMQLVPIYMTNGSIVSAMESSINGVEFNKISRSAITKSMEKQLYVDGNLGVINLKQDLKLSRAGKNILIQTKYEREVPLVANAFLTVKFDNQYERAP